MAEPLNEIELLILSQLKPRLKHGNRVGRPTNRKRKLIAQIAAVAALEQLKNQRKNQQ